MGQFTVTLGVELDAEEAFSALTRSKQRQVVLDHFDCAELMELAEKEDKQRFLEWCKEVVEENE